MRSPREQVFLSLGLPGSFFTSLPGTLGVPRSASTCVPTASFWHHSFSPDQSETGHLSIVRRSSHCEGKEPGYLGSNLVENFTKPQFAYLQSGAIAGPPCEVGGEDSGKEIPPKSSVEDLLDPSRASIDLQSHPVRTHTHRSFLFLPQLQESSTILTIV